jgi:hypothetical protein
MYHGICVAGIDASKDRRVRPIVGTNPLDSRLLAELGGPFAIRRIVDLGKVRPKPSKPEVEDFEFVPKEAKSLKTIGPTTFLARLRGIAADDLSPMEELRRRGNNYVVSEGKGGRSLLIVNEEGDFEVGVDDRGKLRAEWENGINLSVTDVRFYKSDLRTPDPTRLRRFQRELADADEVFIAYGLTRLYRGVHWLQVNAIHLNPWPDWFSR